MTIPHGAAGQDLLDMDDGHVAKLGLKDIPAARLKRKIAELKVRSLCFLLPGSSLSRLGAVPHDPLGSPASRESLVECEALRPTDS